MPFPFKHVRNPLWEEGNGEPESVPLGHPNLDLVDPRQPDAGSPSPTAQPRRVSSAGVPPGSGAPSTPTRMPLSMFDLTHEDVCNASLGSPSAGLQARVRRGSGAPSTPTHMPFNKPFDLTHEDVSNASLGSPSAGFPASIPAGSASNTATPSNAGTPCDTDSQIDLLNLQAYQTNITADPNMPGVVVRNDIHSDRPSWDATVANVRTLQNRRGMYYGGLIRSFDEYQRFKLAQKYLTRRSNAGHLVDMPQDHGGQQQLAGRLGNAMLNLNGIESSLTRQVGSRNGEARTLDSLGVQCVKEMGPFKLDMLAWEFMCAIVEAQRGELELPGDVNKGFKDFSTFMERFVVLEEALRVNKSLVRDALDQGVNRIVADPAGQRVKKNENLSLNKRKQEHIKLGRQVQKGGADAGGKKRTRGPSAEAPTKKRTKLSTAPGIQNALAQPQMGFRQPESVHQQYQFPQPQGMPPLPSQHKQPPQQHPNAYSQPFGMQPAQTQFNYGNPEQHGHVGDRGFDGQYGNPYGPPQQLGFPQTSENQPQTQNGQGFDHFQQQSGNSRQPAQPQIHYGTPEQHGHVHVGDRGDGQYGIFHGTPQQLGVPQPSENQQQTQNGQGLDHSQQQGGYGNAQAVPRAPEQADAFDALDAFMNDIPDTNWGYGQEGVDPEEPSGETTAHPGAEADGHGGDAA